MDRPGLRRILTLALVLALGVPAHAFAAPSLADKKAAAAEAQSRMRTMQGELSSGMASYAKVSGQLAETRGRIAANGRRLGTLEKRLNAIESRLGERASFMYRTRETGPFDMLFAASTFEEFIARFDFLSRIAQDDASLIVEAKRGRVEARRLRADLKKREAELSGLQKSTAAERDRLAKQLDSQQAYFGSLSAEVAAELAAQARAERPAPSKSKGRSGGGGGTARSGNGLSVATVEGRSGSYYVMAGEPRSYRPSGVSRTTQASQYSVAENGTGTSSGRPLDDSDLTCAHKTLPFGTRVAITRGSRRVIVVVTDRGPFSPPGRDLDLTLRAASILGFDGVGNVRYEVVVPN